jgi:hypothetical protein
MNNKKPTTKTTPPPPGHAEHAALAEAEQAVADLEMQRRRQVEQQAEHDEERARFSYQAHVNHDVEARKRLSVLQDAAIRHSHALKDIDAALTVAREKQALARAKLDRVVEQERREQIAGQMRKLVEVAARLDELLASFVAASRDALDIVDSINRLGRPNPSREAFSALGYRAILTKLNLTIWSNRARVMAPAERTDFVQLAAKWSGGANADNESKGQAA